MINYSEKYIHPFTDFGFKKIFGTSPNKGLLIDFLNQVLVGKENIRDLTYLNNELLGKTKRDRAAVFDLYCENEKGEKFIIELQNVKQEYFLDRSIFYSTFPIQNQAPKGKQWDYCLKAVYTIGLLNFGLPGKEEEERYFREVVLMDKYTYEIFYDKLTFIYLEMPKLKKGANELESHFDKWLYVLKHLSELQERPKQLQEKVFEKLFKVAEIAQLNTEDMRKYDESLKVYRDNHNTMEYAKKEARREGLQEGIQLGIKQGREEGMREKQLGIARMLKKNGVPMEVIAKATGLSQEEIDRLSS